MQLTSLRGQTRVIDFSPTLFAECIAAPSRACLLAPPGFLILVIAMLAAVRGWHVAARNARRFNRRFGRLLVAALAILFLTAATAFVYLAVNPEAPAAWADLRQLAAISALGLGLAVLAAAIGYGLGGLLARATGNTPRLGRLGVVIAIDGPAASGKGTLAKRVAEHFRIPVLDTGLLYRAVARDVMARGGKLTDTITAIACANALDPATFSDPELRGEVAGEAASVVAKIPEVRAALLDYQRNFAKARFGAVIDGRDIGTVVCPEAEVKIYVTASPEERARRRHKELEARGQAVSFDAVLEDIHRRDARDTGRAISPLWPAKDAIQLDTSDLNADQVFKEALRIIDFRLNGSSE